jgi:hypothetical protein
MALSSATTKESWHITSIQPDGNERQRQNMESCRLNPLAKLHLYFGRFHISSTGHHCSGTLAIHHPTYLRRSSGCRAPCQGCCLTCSQVSPRLQSSRRPLGDAIISPFNPFPLAARGQAAICWSWLLAKDLTSAAPIPRNPTSHTNSSCLRY